MVPFWVPIIVRPLIFRVPQKGTIILTTTHISSTSAPPVCEVYITSGGCSRSAYSGLLLKDLNSVTIKGIYRDNGKENGNYYNGVIWGLGFRVTIMGIYSK